MYMHMHYVCCLRICGAPLCPSCYATNQDLSGFQSVRGDFLLANIVYECVFLTWAGVSGDQVGEGGLGTDCKQQNCNSFFTLHHFLMVSFTHNVGCARNHGHASALFKSCGSCVCVSSMLLCVFEVCCFVRFKRVALCLKRAAVVCLKRTIVVCFNRVAVCE